MLGTGDGLGAGGISRGRWKVGGTRLEIVDHIQFWGLRSHTPWGLHFSLHFHWT